MHIEITIAAVPQMKRLLAYMIFVLTLFTIGYWITTPRPYIDSSHTHSVLIQPGDTLWAIASRETGEHVDIRSMIHAITELNHVESTLELHPGMTIEVPRIVHRSYIHDLSSRL